MCILAEEFKSYCIYKSLNYDPRMLQDLVTLLQDFVTLYMCECFNHASLEIVEQSNVALLKLLH